MPRNLSVFCGERERERERDDIHVRNDKKERFSINWLKLFQVSVATTLKVHMSIITHWVTELKIFSSQRITYLVVWKRLRNFTSDIYPKEVMLTEISQAFSQIMYGNSRTDSTWNFDTMCSFPYSVLILQSTL